MQTEVQISSKETPHQSQDGESSPTASLSHQLLDHYRQPQPDRFWCTSRGVIYRLCFSSTALFYLKTAHRSLLQEPDPPLLHPFHNSLDRAVALKLATVDQKCYKPNGTAGKNNKELVKVHRSLLLQKQKLKSGILRVSSSGLELRHSLQPIDLISLMLLSPRRHSSATSSILSF